MKREKNITEQYKLIVSQCMHEKLCELGFARDLRSARAGAHPKARPNPAHGGALQIARCSRVKSTGQNWHSQTSASYRSAN